MAIARMTVRTEEGRLLYGIYQDTSDCAFNRLFDTPEEREDFLEQVRRADTRDWHILDHNHKRQGFEGEDTPCRAFVNYPTRDNTPHEGWGTQWDTRISLELMLLVGPLSKMAEVEERQRAEKSGWRFDV